ncbi:MAG: hypothetical protein V5A47_12195 [Bacteroidales bacterium]
MKIYKFDHRGTVHYIAAYSKKQAREIYKQEVDWDLSEVEIYRVPKKEWDKAYIINPNVYIDPNEIPEEDEEKYSGGYLIQESFADWVNRNDKPDIIATNDF